VTPCIVITRDRATYTQLCVASLELVEGLDIHIVDHGTTWEPMLSYLDASPHPVHHCGSRPPRALWEWEGLRKIVGTGGRYLVTDPDLVLHPDCPPDWLLRLGHELDHGDAVKVGLGLALHDLPDTVLTAKVKAWESSFWGERTPCGTAFRAPVDTTLALYPPLDGHPIFRLTPAARLDAPYLVKHLPWYGDPDEAETIYYRSRVLPGSSHWINGGW
jgi:hypothetical protein